MNVRKILDTTLRRAIDVIQRAWRGLVADRGFDGFAADDPSQTHVPHQSRHRATGNIEALAFELPPDLAHAIDAEVLIEDAPDLALQLWHPAWRAPTAWPDRATWPHGRGRSRGRSARSCRSARPHAPHDDRR
jgi:hypothetical protein